MAGHLSAHSLPFTVGMSLILRKHSFSLNTKWEPNLPKSYVLMVLISEAVGVGQPYGKDIRVGLRSLIEKMHLQ
jgi:hypothetical protein